MLSATSIKPRLQGKVKCSEASFAFPLIVTNKLIPLFLVSIQLQIREEVKMRPLYQFVSFIFLHFD